MVKALASHQCGSGLIPGLGIMCGLSLLLVLALAPRRFSPGFPVFPSSKTNISKFQFSVLLRLNLIIIYLFIYLFIFCLFIYLFIYLFILVLLIKSGLVVLQASQFLISEVHSVLARFLKDCDADQLVRKCVSC